MVGQRSRRGVRARIVMRGGPSAALAALFFVALAPLAGGCGDRADERPSIVLVVLDTVRYDFTGGSETRRSLTPHLDRLAEEGTLFRRAWSNAPWTVPSHASLFTGLLPSRHGCTSLHPKLDTPAPTLAELLAEAGYRTGGFYSNPWLDDRAAALLRGFAHRQETKLTGFFNGLNRYPDGDQGGRGSSGHIARWLAEQQQGEPFLLFVNYLEAHLPYDPPADYRRRYLPGVSGADWIPVQWGHEYNAGLHPTEDVDWKLIDQLYAGDVNTADRLLGSLVALLERNGLYDDCVIIVTSDHGENLGDHGYAEHQFSVHESLLRVPLVIRAPGRLAPGVRDDPVMLLDVFATILDLAGITPEDPPPLARSLLAPPAAGIASRPLTAEYTGPPEGLLALLGRLNPALDTTPLAASYRTMRVGDLRLTVGSLGTVELHDLAADPDQAHDLAGSRPADLAAMQETLGRQPVGDWRIDEDRVEIDAETRSRLRALGYVH